MSWYKKTIVDRRCKGFKKFKARHGFDGLGIISEFADLSFETWNGIVPRSELNLIQNDIGVDMDRLQVIIEDAKAAGLMFEDERGIFVDKVPESKESLDRTREETRKRVAEFRERQKTNSLNETKDLENCNALHNTVRNDSTYLSNTSNTSDNSLNKETVIIETDWTPDDPLAEWMADANSQFDFQNPVQCLSSGRRPLKKYPNIWITPSELAECFRNYDKIIPKDEWRRVFQKVDTFARDQIQTGVKPQRVRCASALMGWAKREVVAELNEETKLKKNKGLAA